MWDLDKKNFRAVVNLSENGLVVIDLRVPNQTTTDPDAVVLARIPAGSNGNFNTGMTIDPDTGTAYASSENEGVVAVRIEIPRPRFVSAADANGIWDEWDTIVPLGAKARPRSGGCEVLIRRSSEL